MGLNPGLDVLPPNMRLRPSCPANPFPHAAPLHSAMRASILPSFCTPGERYAIDPRAMLPELGRLQAVAGQGDWILDVALELAREK